MQAKLKKTGFWLFLYAGEMGVVTSQRSNELSFLHVHDGGLIGLDNACVHGESCRWFSCLPAASPGLRLLACLAACVQRWPDMCASYSCWYRSRQHVRGLHELHAPASPTNKLH